MSNAVDTVQKQRPAHWFKPGVSGNPAGRPRSSRVRHSENFLATFAADFEAHGAQVIERVRKEDPSTYLKVASGLLPKEAEIALSVDHKVQIEAVLADFRGLNLPDKSVEKLLRLAARSKVIDADDA
jgi:hypothetical protein